MYLVRMPIARFRVSEPERIEIMSTSETSPKTARPIIGGKNTRTLASSPSDNHLLAFRTLVVSIYAKKLSKRIAEVKHSSQTDRSTLSGGITDPKGTRSKNNDLITSTRYLFVI